MVALELLALPAALLLGLLFLWLFARAHSGYINRDTKAEKLEYDLVNAGKVGSKERVAIVNAKMGTDARTESELALGINPYRQTRAAKLREKRAGR
jgi:hypothetical protein